MYFEIAKVVIYTLALFFLGVFGRQASMIYLAGTLLLLAEKPAIMIPEKVLAIVSFLLLARILAKGVAAKKARFRGKLQDTVMVFVFSSALFALFNYLNVPKAAVYLASLISMTLIFGFANKKLKAVVSLGALAWIAYIYSGESGIILKSMIGGIIYSAFFIAYKTAYDCISYECAFGDLRPGMLALEFMWVEKTELKRCGFLEGILRRPKDKKEYILSPLAPICEGNMDAICRIGKAFGSNTVKVQASIDARPYVAAGLLIVFFLNL